MTEPVKWPDGARCAIMMTFDLDGESPWIHRDPALAERPLHMSMGAYGPKTGMPRILELLVGTGSRPASSFLGGSSSAIPRSARHRASRAEVGTTASLHEKPLFSEGPTKEEEELLVKSLDNPREDPGRQAPRRGGAPSADNTPWTCSRSTVFVYHSKCPRHGLPVLPTRRPSLLVEFSQPPGATTTRPSSCSARCRPSQRGSEPGTLVDLVRGVRGMYAEGVIHNQNIYISPPQGSGAV